MTDEQLREVEHLVNAKIRENIPLTEYRNIPIEKAKELGAIASVSYTHLSTKPYAVPEEPRIIGQSTTICPKKPVGTFLLS